MPRRFPPAWATWTLKTRLAWLRAQKNITLSEASRLMDITKGHLWEMESGGSKNPRLSTLLAVCRVYDISVQDLLEGIAE